MVAPQARQLRCKRAVAVTPMPAEILVADFRALLKQPQSDDHGFPPEWNAFRRFSTVELDNSQSICYKRMIA